MQDLASAGLIVGMRNVASMRRWLEEAIALVISAGDPSPAETTLCGVELDFSRGRESEIADGVRWLRKLLPDALVSGSGFDGVDQIEAFGNAGGKHFTNVPSFKTSRVISAVTALPYACGADDLTYGIYKIHPTWPVNPLDALEICPKEVECRLIPCFRGMRQFSTLCGTGLVKQLAAAGAAGIQVWLEDAIAYAPQIPAGGWGVGATPLGLLDHIRMEFLEHVPR